jgi:hypothetical protein
MLLGFVLPCLGSPMSSSAFARVTWSEIGSIQILEGPDRLWVFVEVVRITDYTDEVLMHLMSRHRDREIVSQTVFNIDRLGNVTEKAITRGTGPTLHPNRCRIFRRADGFSLYEFASPGRPASLYRWREDRFSPTDERDSEELGKKLLRAEQADRLATVIDELDAISGREGWRCVAEDAVMFNEDAAPFASIKHGIKISVRLGNQQAQPGASRPGRSAGSNSALAWLRPSAVAAVLSDLAELRPSALIAMSDLQTKPWSRTLIEVDTKGKRVRRKSLWKR